MKVEEPNWFMRWEEELPSPDELMPLSQTLITPDLALAFDLFPIRNSNSNQHLHSQTQHDSSEMAGGGNSGGGGGEEQARTLKRPRLVWTPQLHKRFVDAVSHLGIKHAVPKTIMQLMNVDGLTRENVASHLQKYRLYLKRMQGISSGTNGVVSHSDEQLFANGPIPHHFLIQRPPAVGGGGRPEPLVPIVALQQHHHQMAADAAAAQHYRQQQFNHHRHQGSFRWPLNYDHGGFLGWQHSGLQRTVGAAVPTSALVEDSDSGDGPRVLTLFPTNDR